MYKRIKYLNWMQKYLNTPFIKVLVGMRRVGKSTLIQQFQELLISEKNIAQTQMLFIDKESLEHRYIETEEQLFLKVNDHFRSLKPNTIKYLFIDEIQEILNWEKAVNSFLKEGSFDIYITGSNAHLLSSDLATYLTGRYVQLQVFPLSYKEFLAIKNAPTHTADLFNHYMNFGGFPGLTHLPSEESLLYQTLDGLYNSIVLRDVIERYQIRNTALLEKMVHFFFDNIGNLVNAKKIADYVKSQRISVSVDAVQNYMSYLSACFAISQVKRFDLKRKRILEVNEKHYLGDLGLRHAILGFRPGDISQLLENLVYLELAQRGYKVFIGIWDKLEVDFVAEKDGKRLYIQVSYLLASPETREREFRSLKKINDSHPKLVLSMDTILRDEDGIQHLFLPDFLMNE